jgi:Flp pilus assembly pilin Flp
MRTVTQKVIFTIHELLFREQGQDLVEYALVVALLALGSAAAMSQIGTGISMFFVNATTTINAS